MEKRELLEIAKDRREWLLSNKYGGNTYSIIREDGEYEDFVNRICYRGLNYIEKKEENKAVFIVDITRSKLSKKLSLEYISWWVNHSFVSKAFVTKKEEAILEKGSIMDCSHPSSYVVLAMIGLRYMWEFPKIIKNWEMFKEFTNYDAAVIMAHMFTKDKNNVWLGKFKVGNNNHTWFQNCWNKKQFEQFVNHDLHAMKELPSMATHMSYSPLISIFGQDSPPNTNSEKSNLIYPPSENLKYIESSISGTMSSPVRVYNKCDMKVWIKKTFDLNYLSKKGMKYES